MCLIITANANAGSQPNSRPNQRPATFRARGGPELGVSDRVLLLSSCSRRRSGKAKSIFEWDLNLVSGAKKAP